MDKSVCSNKNLLVLFLEQVEKQPDATALITLEGTVSYKELHQQSEYIAIALQNLALSKESSNTCLIGVCMQRSTDAICALLGILKAGAAYLPIDPSYPLPLQRRMIRSAGLHFLLTDDATQPVFASLVEHVLTVPELYQQYQTHSQITNMSDSPLASVSSDHLFHVLYTSGSTDEPKGVCGTHGQMQRRLEWLWKTFPLYNSDICCQKTALHFVDASLEIFGTLLKGLPLLVVPDSHGRNPEKLLALLADYNVTRISLVVSQLRALLIANATIKQSLPQLKLCIVSGEPLTNDLIDDFWRILPNTRLVNLYGCSEVPEISYFEISKHAELDAGVPIGYPVSGTELHIVDENLREVEQGEVGELLVGSHLQALGYLNRREETEARFIDNPFGGIQQLYLTGDRVRMNFDGVLLFEGRADDQVKIRGHRIELSAVESTLKNCGEPLNAVKVIVQESPLLAENRTLVAFVTPVSIDTAKLLVKIRQRTPRHLQVQRVISLDKLPSTPSGKIDRRKLSDIAHSSLTFNQTKAKDVCAHIIQLWRTVLLTDTVDTNENFFEIGGDSLRLAQLHQHLCDAFPDFNLSLAELLEYPTVAAQLSYLHQVAKPLPEQPDVNLLQDQNKDKSIEHNIDKDIAVISMACRFPDAKTPEEFWDNLCAGVDSISDFSEDELEQEDVQLCNDTSYVKSGAVLENIADFDAEFFGFTDKEAAILDPQQRLLLECAWETMERAGVVLDKNNAHRTGIYTGSSASSYFLNNVVTSRPITEATLTEYQENLANDRNFLATRIAYRLQLTGPAINVQTACSTGLVVVHMACQSLRNGECDLALAGSVSLKIPQKAGYLFEEGMIRSSDGRCRAFDAQAEGTLFGNGAGMVLLKPLVAAQADGDQILAVIKGSAINNDGALKVGYTAPSVVGQTEVVEAALEIADIDPRTIGYVEAHGTGTRLGDPIEIAALTRAYRQRGWIPDDPKTSSKQQYCAIGSVKTNIGHLDEAAGIAGFIKTVLVLQNKKIPPSLHFHRPNPEIDFANSPFQVNTQLSSWHRNKVFELPIPRRAGVSSFGMGGTNCHLILEEAPKTSMVEPRTTITKTEASFSGHQHHLLVLSATRYQTLFELTDQYRSLLAEKPLIDLADLCGMAAIGRNHLAYRYATVASSVSELSEKLSKLPPSSSKMSMAASTASTKNTGRKIAFLFTGQGSQYLDMAYQLYTTSTSFRASVDRCAAILDPILPRPLLSVMFAAKTDDKTGITLLSQTQYTQPALFTIEFSLAELWQSWGITPDLVMGHSMGEYVAACVAGVFELEDALHIVVERGRLIQALPENGGMLAVALSEVQVEQLLQSYAEDVCIAAINGLTSTVISGKRSTLNVITEQLQAQGVLHKSLDVSHAFHSALLEPMLVPFATAFDQLNLNVPKIPVISNFTGDVVSSELSTPDYWIKHTRHGVRFADGVKTLQSQNTDIIIEIGPSPLLLGMVAEMATQLEWENEPLLLPSLRKGQDDWSQLLSSVGQLYEQGCDINWHTLYSDQPWRKIILPTTPFQRKHCWVEHKPLFNTFDHQHYDGHSMDDALEQVAKQLLAQGKLTEEQLKIVPLLVRELKQSANKKPQEQWQELLYKPTWQRLPIPVITNNINADNEGAWVILADQSGIGAALAAQGKAKGITVFLLYTGKNFTFQDQNSWTINPADPQQFKRFWQQLASMTSKKPVQRLIYLWSLDEALLSNKISTTAIMHSQQRICGGVLGLLPWLNESEASKVRLWFVTCGAQEIVSLTENVTSHSAGLNPLQSTLWGMGRSLALEYPHAWGGMIDLSPTESIEDRAASLWGELCLLINSPVEMDDHEEQLMLRDSNRYVARLKAIDTPTILTTSTITSLQAEAVYLITGGLGALGLEIAETLTTLGAGHLLLVSRRGVTTTVQRQRLEALRQSGVIIQTPKLDVADEQEVDKFFAKLSIEKAQIPLKGIIHAAGTIALTPSTQPSWDRFSPVLQAKVAGSWNLHQASQNLDLDFFVLFSSASSLLGLSGHSDYSAANAFLDALANYRLQQNLPALSISWGDWANMGMAAGGSDRDTMENTGLGALPLTKARTALQKLLAQQGHFAVIRADWSRFIATFQAHQGFLSACINQEGIFKEEATTTKQYIESQTNNSQTSIRTLISATAESKREHLLQEQLTIMVGKVLGHTDISRLDFSNNLLSLGFDSLMLIELRNQLRRELGLQIALPRMLQGPTINELVNEAIQLFTDQGDNPEIESTGEDQWNTIII